MRLTHFSLVLALLLSSTACSESTEPEPAPSPEPTNPAPTPAERDPRLAGLVEGERTKQTLTGLAMAAARADGKILSAASGDAQLDPRRAFDPNDVTCIGSITKTFTAVVVLQLVDEGKLSLDATIDAFVPEQPRGERIRVRHLLSHTSGIPEYAETIRATPDLFARMASPWQPTELVAIANRAPSKGEPGTVTFYSNANYILLGLIVERITGTSWEENVKRRIIQRAGLAQTSYTHSGPIAHGYVRDPSAPVPRDVFGAVHPSFGWSAGGMVSSAEDLARFARALFDGKLLRPETLERMKTPVGSEKNGDITIQYGLGLMRADVKGTVVLGHRGGVVGYTAFFAMSNGNVVATASNTDNADVLSPTLTVLQSM